VHSFKRLLVVSHRSERWVVGISLLFILLGSPIVHGQETWQGSTTTPSSWFLDGNWSSETLPTNADSAVIANGGTAVVDRTDAAVGTLRIDGGSTLQISPGGVIDIVNSFNIGPQGTYLFTGGEVDGTGSWINDGIVEQVVSANLVANISGTGRFLMDITTEGGTLAVFSTSNTYSGSTMLLGGTFMVNASGALSPKSAFTINSTLDMNGFSGAIGSLAGNGMVTNNSAETTSILTVGADNSNTTFNGVLENGDGILGLTKMGTGTLNLSSTNTYSGATTVRAGTLQAGSTGAFSPNSAFTVSSRLDLNGFSNKIGSLAGGGIVTNGGGALAVLTIGTDNTSTTFSGSLEDGVGSLAVAKIGIGTLVLSGANSFTGGTTISGGTLQLGDGGTTGSISGNVINNGTLTFDRSDLVVFGGVISGAGNLVQSGSGTVTLTVANTYTGTTTVNNGSLIVDGSIASPLTVVNAGALLGGHGTIGGDLVNNGIVGQGNSTETLTVGGNYTQNAGGTLRIGVAGVAPGQHDLIAVNGHAAVGGTLQFISLGGFTLQPGNQVTFLTAKNGITGTFSNIQNQVTTGTIVNATITSLANSIVLQGTQGSFANTPGVATTPNEGAVAKALDSAAGDPREAALFAFLNSQPLANLPHDLSLIAPTQITSINATAVSVGKVQVSNIGQRLANIRGGSTGFSSAGFSLNGGSAGIGEGFAGVSGPEGKSGPPVFAPTPDNRWGVFVTGLGEFTDVDSTPNAAGYNVDTGGFTFGLDYRLTPNFAIGLTAGYAHTTVNLDGGGHIDVNGGKMGLYATVFGNGFYLDAAASGGPSGYNTHRTALQGTASGSTDGADFNVLVAGGYDWKKGNLTIGPTASFQYSYVGLNSFSETGSLAPLNFPDQNTESERTAFGAKASYEFKVGQITVLPEVNAAWQHEFGDTAYSVVAGFASGAGNNFTVSGPDIGRDSLLVGAGATVIWNERVSTYVFYDGEFARTNYISNNVSAGVRIAF
jgi:autotransporter-associated beta strand protein